MKISKQLKILKDYFMDVTFQIIPKKLNPYKLLILAAIDKNRLILLIFILIKYLDSIAYKRIFNYLNNNFEFNPNIIHTHFEKAMQEVIKKINFKKKILFIQGVSFILVK